MRLGAFDTVATILRILDSRLLLSCHGPALSVMNMLLSNPEEQLLWKNVHDQRGDDSLWLRNFDEAAATFRGELVKRGNLHPPNCKQLSSWFERAALRHAVPPCQKDDIFRFGAEGCNIRKEATELRTTLANDPIDSHLLQLTHPIRRAKSGKAHRSSVKDRNRQRKAVDSKIEREGQMSDSPCIPCKTAEKDCLVHSDYAVCRHCILKRISAQKCQSGGTRGRHLARARPDYRCAEPQDRWDYTESGTCNLVLIGLAGPVKFRL